MTDKRYDIDPGPYATPEQAQKANDEAYTILLEILPMNLPSAAEYIRSNPPSAEAIATLPFLYQDLVTNEQRRKRFPGSSKGGIEAAKTNKLNAAQKQGLVFKCLDQNLPVWVIAERVGYSEGHIRKLRKLYRAR